MSAPRRILSVAVLVAAVVAGWALRAGASTPEEQQMTLLQIKDRAMNVSRLSAMIDTQAVDPQTKLLARQLTFRARQVFDRAEKVLAP